MKSIITIATICLIIFGSCKKKDNSTTTNNSPNNGNSLTSMEKLLVGNWKLQSCVEIKDSSTSAVTVTLSTKTLKIEDCEQDDIYVFNADRTYTVDDGSKVCSGVSANYSGFRWNIGASDSTIHGYNVFSPYLQSDYPRIVEIDNSTLKLVFWERNSSPGIYDYIISYRTIYTLQKQ